MGMMVLVLVRLGMRGLIVRKMRYTTMVFSMVVERRRKRIVMRFWMGMVVGSF